MRLITRRQMCQLLMSKKDLLPDGKLAPKLFVVNGRPYWFLNAARRAAYGTRHVIQVVDIFEAYETLTGNDRSMLPKGEVDWLFEQTGETFDGKLFCDPTSAVLAEATGIKVLTEPAYMFNH